MNIAHVLTVLAVRDLENAVLLFQGGLGLDVAVRTTSYVELRAKNGMRLGLYARRGYAKHTREDPVLVPEGRIGPTQLYFHVEELSVAVERFERAGARMLSGISRREWGDDAAYFADDDGNVIVLARPIDAGRTTIPT